MPHDDGIVSDLSTPTTGAVSIRPGVWLFLSIFTGHAAAALIYDALPPILVMLAKHFGGGEYGRMVAEQASTLPFFGVILAGLAAGPMTERFGIHRILPAMLILFAVSGSAGLIIDSAALLLTSRVVMGFSIGVMLTCCTALIALGYDGPGRARMNGMLFGIGALFGVALLIVSGFVAERFGWRSPFALHAAIALVFIIPVLKIGPVASAEVRAGAFFLQLRRLKPILLPCVLAALLFVIGFLYNVQIAFLMAESGVGDPQRIAAVFSAQAGAVMIVSPLYGRFGMVLGAGRSVKLAFCLHAVALMIGWTASSMPVFVLTVIFGGSGTAIALPALWTWVMRVAPGDLIARALGLATMSLYLGGTISPLLMTPLRLATSGRGQFLVASLCLILVLVAVEIAGRIRPASRQTV